MKERFVHSLFMFAALASAARERHECAWGAHFPCNERLFSGGLNTETGPVSRFHGMAVQA
jgi:hypothetical protein